MSETGADVFRGTLWEDWCNYTLHFTSSRDRQDAKREVPVVEIFGPVIQGEGSMAGARTHFVRFGGCDNRCSWCDTLYAVIPGEVKKNSTRRSLADIVDTLREMGERTGCYTVTLSGGNPAMHNLDWLVAELMSWGWMVVVETQGTLAPAWLLGCSVVTLSPKPPSSYDESYRRGVAEELLPIALFANGKSATREREDHAAFAHTLAQLRTADDGPEICVKIVVFDTLDYKFASGVIKKVRGMQWSGRCTFFLQPGTIQGCDDIEEERALVLGRTRQVWDQLCADKDPWMEEVRILPQIHTLVYGSAARGV